MQARPAVIYITNARIPTDWAHGLQIIKTCAALAEAGVALELWTPAKKLHIKESPFSYYGVKNLFPIRRLATLDASGILGGFGFLLQTFSFAFFVRIALLRQAKGTVLYCRDEAIAAFLIFFGERNIVWESHSGAWNIWARYVVSNARAVVSTSEGGKALYVEHGATSERVVVIPNGIDLAEYAHPETKDAARRRLGLPADKNVALYVGMFEGWKGMDTLLAAAERVGPRTLITVIGGEDESLVKKFAAAHPRVRFLGYHPARELPNNLAAADVLLVPNTAKNNESVRFTSPLKLFAYMASEKPIVASNLPSIREILGEDDGFLVEPDNPDALAGGIETALADTEEAEKRARHAYEHVKEYTWEARAKKIRHLIMTELNS